jgi:hypothetical protein
VKGGDISVLNSEFIRLLKFLILFLLVMPPLLKLNDDNETILVVLFPRRPPKPKACTLAFGSFKRRNKAMNNLEKEGVGMDIIVGM